MYISSVELLHYYNVRRVLFYVMANCFYKHVGRANTPSFYDECLGQGVVLAQSHVGSVSVPNRRRDLG
jgi:hypothetical protein